MKEKNIEELEKKRKKLYIKFLGLPKEEKELLAYETIIKIVKDNSFGNEQDTIEAISELMMAADLKYFKPLMIYYSQQLYQEYQEIYKESLVCYNNVMENYKKLAQDLKLNSALELSHLLTIMLWNGYFSVNKEHFYSLQNRLLLPGMNYFDVIKGRGVCLGYAELLDSYLSTCEKKSGILLCKLPKEKKSFICDYHPKIKTNISINKSSRGFNSIMTFFLSGLINTVYDHAITLIEENGKLFAYDPTNLCALNINNFSAASVINGKGEFQIKPLESLAIEPNSDHNNIFGKLLGDIEPGLSREEFIFSFEYLMELVQNNKSLLDDAYDNIHSDLEFIDRQTKEIERDHKALKRIK